MTGPISGSNSSNEIIRDSERQDRYEAKLDPAYKYVPTPEELKKAKAALKSRTPDPEHVPLQNKAVLVDPKDPATQKELEQVVKAVKAADAALYKGLGDKAKGLAGRVTLGNPSAAPAA
jgi:hypothetical protein